MDVQGRAGVTKARDRFALHAATTMHTNVMTDIRIAREVGYDGVELYLPKLMRYLDQGFSVEDLKESLGSLQVTMLDVLIPIETRDRNERARLVAECEAVARIAAEISCPAIQAVALDDFEEESWPSMRRSLVRSLDELGSTSASFGVRLGLEPVTFSPFRNLDRAIEVVESVGVEKVGLCLDTWHLWTSGISWDSVSAVDPDMIVAVHLGDTEAKAGGAWSDDDRAALPGEGVLPLDEGIDALMRTGFEGMWAVEMKSKRHWEWDPEQLAREILVRVKPLVLSHRN
jgi:sugar phosphate isomerase/epimerase